MVDLSVISIKKAKITQIAHKSQSKQGNFKRANPHKLQSFKYLKIFQSLCNLSHSLRFSITHK